MLAAHLGSSEEGRPIVAVEKRGGEGRGGGLEGEFLPRVQNPWRGRTWRRQEPSIMLELLLPVRGMAASRTDVDRHR